MAEKVYLEWVQKQRTKGTSVRKVGNNYYLYKHSSKRVPGKKNPVPSDTYIGRITPEGIVKSNTKKVTADSSEIIVNAAEMMKTKRDHWTVENRLHYVLDETFGEDKCTIRKGKNTASALRKTAYNIVRLIQLLNPKSSPYVPDIIDDITTDLHIGAKMIMELIPSFY